MFTHYAFPTVNTTHIHSHLLVQALYRGVDKSNQEGNKLMFLSEWREFPSAPCLVGKYKNP